MACAEKSAHKPVAINGGDRTMVVLFDDGVLYGWGSNDTGQLDRDGWLAQTTEPVRLFGLPCASAASVGDVGIAIAAGARAYTWGGDLADARGAGPGDADKVFRELGLTDMVAVSSKRATLCAGTELNAYWWGALANEYAEAPTPVSHGGAAVAANGVASCLVDADGGVWCWGGSVDGLLGPQEEDSIAPVPIELPAPAILVRVDAVTACALLESGAVYCWGSNFAGALGRNLDDEALSFDPLPAPIVESGPFTGLTMAPNCRSCAWRRTGEVYCWGPSAGVFGPGDGTPEGRPRRVREIEPAEEVGLIESEVCAIGFDDVVRCRIPQPDPDMPQGARVLNFDGLEPRED